jgi:hypothetical protein
MLFTLIDETYVSGTPAPSGIHKLICKLKTVHIG